jgi:hypothetical protein
MGELWVDPDRLRQVSPHFEQLGEDVNSALETLKQGLHSEGRCWGTDGPGRQFEKGYPQGDVPGGVEGTLKALAQLVTKLKATGDKITTTANGVQNQDHQNARSIAQQTRNV